MSSNSDQDVNWAGRWEVGAGCIERKFTLQYGYSMVLPRYRVQVQGFYGSMPDLYDILQRVEQAVIGDFKRIIQGICQQGRTIITLSVDKRPLSVVVVVERDPEDFVHLTEPLDVGEQVS